MKKLASFTVAVGLMASIAASASAAEVTGTADQSTVTGSTYNEQFETVITPADIKPATPMIILTKATPFHFSTTSMTPAGWLSAQTIDTTGAVMTDAWGNEWREVYTWLGKAWIKVPSSAYVITP
ncbi:hypothetical protein R70723_28555 [Paenibacillus sp. FSL R7-0273]|uniref:hypothetical protein n=1 Tax=Paenibacillus sp. FSL R7-0273 TaxID=1536772 RepID=UPI0004F6F175|nr:hypothetical protein [Paenibacillus sp. FSL R7-0273]AIQ49394.1 hypothetical protein R70723_28555 [Paenibacillus sp. FSL R7-0273]OMF85296.1 hypothetical protein BK144_28140 [Paenibacillus sp. FSL R7-0273]